MRQADLSRKQFRHHGNPQGQHKHDVGDADLEGIGKLVGLPADLLDVEAQRKDDRRHAEQHHGRESHPAGVGDHVPIAGRWGQQNDGGGHTYAANEYADQGD